jgi:methylmalonyl-CoA carboxyltransferase 5S subunit
MTGEFSDLMLGYYGETDAPKNPDIVEKAKEFAKKPEITCRPADLLHPEWEKLQDEALKLEGNNGTDEDVLTYAMFPAVAKSFFKDRSKGPKNLGKDPAGTAPKPADPSQPGYLAAPIEYEVTLGGKTSKVKVSML